MQLCTLAKPHLVGIVFFIVCFFSQAFLGICSFCWWLLFNVILSGIPLYLAYSANQFSEYLVSSLTFSVGIVAPGIYIILKNLIQNESIKKLLAGIGFFFLIILFMTISNIDLYKRFYSGVSEIKFATIIIVISIAISLIMNAEELVYFFRQKPPEKMMSIFSKAKTQVDKAQS